MKKIGSAIYVHRSAIKQIENKYHDAYILIEKFAPKNFKYEIIKFDTKTKAISYIESHDWNTSNEPTVGDSYRVDPITNTVKIIKSKQQIYHHKWMFVDDNYKGFDVEESRKRSAYWGSVIPNTKEIKSRIGYKKYWYELLEKYNIEK